MKRIIFGITVIVAMFTAGNSGYSQIILKEGNHNISGGKAGDRYCYYAGTNTTVYFDKKVLIIFGGINYYYEAYEPIPLKSPGLTLLEVLMQIHFLQVVSQQVHHFSPLLVDTGKV